MDRRSSGVSWSNGLLIVAALAAAPSRAAEPVAAAVPLLVLRIDPAGFEARECDIRAVIESAAGELWRHFPDQRIEPIVVVRGTGGPITLFERNDRREIVIRLDTGGTFWSQYAYQFAHEFCHVLCGSKPGDGSNLWFEETICETGSLYALRGMARSWSERPPYPNWRDYRDALRGYADDTMRRWSHVEEIVRIGLPAFHARHAAGLRDQAVDRDLNGSMAVILLRAFEERPEHWEAIRWLNAGKTAAPASFSAHLAAWREAVPERHRPFVERLAGLFGQSLDDDSARP